RSPRLQRGQDDIGVEKLASDWPGKASRTGGAVLCPSCGPNRSGVAPVPIHICTSVTIDRELENGRARLLPSRTPWKQPARQQPPPPPSRKARRPVSSGTPGSA